MRWAARALVGVVLLVAGVAKLTSRGWSARESAHESALGAPRWAVQATPFAEIAIGAALVAGVDYAAVAAIALLASFTVLLVRALMRGVKAPCACFGSVRTRPVTWWSVARNVALIALAVFSLT